MKRSALMLLVALPFTACDCSDTSDGLRAECYEAEECSGSCVTGVAERSGGPGTTSTRIYCRPDDAEVCRSEPTTGVDEDGQCWHASTSCLPQGVEPAPCDPFVRDVQEPEQPAPNSSATPDWANNGPSGTACPEGCATGEACLAGVCVTACKADVACDEGEACVFDDAVATCVREIEVCGGGNSHVPDEESCIVDWDGCDGATYVLDCAPIGDEQRCSCLVDGIEVGSFRWHDAVCFCGTEEVVARECGIVLRQIQPMCAEGNYNNLGGE